MTDDSIGGDEVTIDEAFLSALIGRHQAAVFAICLRMLGHRQDAEDVTQETFTRLTRYLDRWDRRRPIEPYLLTIAGNRCRTLLAKRRSTVPLTGAAEPACDADVQLSRATMLSEEVDRVLASLPSRQRKAFGWFHREALTYAEIAQRLDCPLGTVKTLVHRARTELIDQLSSRDVIHRGNGGVGEVKVER